MTNFTPDTSNTILRTLVGSTVHGLNVPDGTEDRDEMGICIESPENLIGFDEFQQYIYRSAEERAGKNVRSQAGDLDLVVYSLRKYISLCLKGNPSAILPLYVPEDHIVQIKYEGYQLRKMRDDFLSKKMIKAFLGYLRNQKERLIGTRGQKRNNRPELVEKYGWDTKYGSQMLRLGYQGLEIVNTGKLELPMDVPIRDFLISVRTGEVSEQDCITLAELMEQELEYQLSQSDWPEQPDYQRVQQWMIHTYLAHWEEPCLN